MNNLNVLGRFLDYQNKRRGIKKTQLALEMGIEPSQLSAIMRGKLPFRDRYIDPILNFYRLTELGKDQLMTSVYLSQGFIKVKLDQYENVEKLEIINSILGLEKKIKRK